MYRGIHRKLLHRKHFSRTVINSNYSVMRKLDIKSCYHILFTYFSEKLLSNHVRVSICQFHKLFSIYLIIKQFLIVHANRIRKRYERIMYIKPSSVVWFPSLNLSKNWFERKKYQVLILNRITDTITGSKYSTGEVERWKSSYTYSEKLTS